MALPPLLKRLASALPPNWQRGLRRRYRALRDAGKLMAAGAYDLRNYALGSGVLGRTDRDVLETLIIKSYHRIEKGLALARPRPGFGADAVDLLLDDLALYLGRHGGDWVTQSGLKVLDSYCAFNDRAGVDITAIQARLASLKQRQGTVTPAQDVPAGTMTVSRDVIQAAANVPFGAFVQSRYSVRQFAEQAVDPSMLREAVRQAQYAPSVCNRQAVQVHLIQGAGRTQRLLAFQNGNRGFGEGAGAVLIITASQSAFHTVGERYQCWIDGGLFAMTLVYALHAKGLGSCCLNWSAEPAQDKAFKLAAGLPKHDAVIMLLAVGHLPDELVVASSGRRPADEVLRLL